MPVRTVLIGLGYAAGALLLAVAVIVPVFYVINLIYDDGDGLIPLLISVLVAWLLLAILLRRRRITL